jgi:hypothetical protein
VLFEGWKGKQIFAASAKCGLMILRETMTATDGKYMEEPPELGEPRQPRQ